MSTITDLENRRDQLAGHVAELQRALDDLDGSEELVSVQKMSNDLDAAQRLLAALDRQLTAAYAAQRAQEIAAREARRQQAAKEAAAIRARLRDDVFTQYDLVSQLELVTAEFPDLAAAAARTRLQLLGYMRLVGVDMSTSLTAGVVPVRR